VDGRTDVRTDGQTFPPLMLLGRLGVVDLNIGEFLYWRFPSNLLERRITYRPNFACSIRCGFVVDFVVQLVVEQISN